MKVIKEFFYATSEAELEKKAMEYVTEANTICSYPYSKKIFPANFRVVFEGELKEGRDTVRVFKIELYT